MLSFIISKNDTKESQGENPVYSSAPTATPTNRELYTSFVRNASTIASNGGTSDHQVPINIEPSIFSFILFSITFHMIIPCPGSGTCLVITGYPFLFYWMMHKYAIIIFYSFLFHANAWFIGPLPAPRSSLNSNASERYCFALFTDSSSSNSFARLAAIALESVHPVP